MRKGIDEIVDYIRTVRIEECDPQVQEQAKKCLLDLAMVTACGAKNESAGIAGDYARKCLPGTEATLLRDGSRASLMGATLANAVAANALDMDDGYSLTKGHPGAGIFAGLLAAAEATDCSYGDALSALLAGYEVSMRHGLCLQDYYGFYHSTGAYAGVGTAAAAGKLFGLSPEELGNALGIADYFGPFTPCMRTVREPSLNKDGIYYGSKLGMEAVLLAKSGFDGKAHILSDEKYADYVKSLGKKYYIHDLYFKFFSCCRWAQGALTAIADLKKETDIPAERIDSIRVFSYGASGELYRGMPRNETEAQYNMLYPIAAYLVHGDFGPVQSSRRIDASPCIERLMHATSFENDPDYEAQFPAKRYTRVEIRLDDGRLCKSKATEPLGEPGSGVSRAELIDKGVRINSIYNDESRIRALIARLLDAKYTDRFKPILADLASLAAEDGGFEPGNP